MRPQKYVFTLLAAFLFVGGALAQCMMLPTAIDQQLQQADKIVEGKVTNQSSFIGSNGNIYTTNHIEVYRVFKGNVGFDEEVTTEGGIYGNLMQVVTPSAQMNVDDYGIIAFANNQNRASQSIATMFFAVDEKSGSVFGCKGVANREQLYEIIARSTGSEIIELKRLPADVLRENQTTLKSAPQLSSVFPVDVTAGTQSVLTINGQGFGNERGTGYVAFRNANDGGLSFVALQSDPHYINWSDTEIQLYVPSATLYNNTVAGTGEIQVRTDNGQLVSSSQLVTVDYAKSEVVFEENLNSTMLVGMQNGGYEFSVNENLSSLLGGSQMAEKALEKWACNTGISYTVNEALSQTTDWSYDGQNLIGLSDPGQLPSYLLGKTITTFSGCGTSNGLQWNLVEVDVLLNADINWWTEEGMPASNAFDMETSILHELGHAHLLQHNNNEASPMYFELTAGAKRRNLDAMTDIAGGQFITDQAATAEHTCGEEQHEVFDHSQCNLSVINSLDEIEKEGFNTFPNPFQNELTVSTSMNEGSTFQLFDATGRIVANGNLNTSQTTISTSALPSGVYLLRVESGVDVFTQRLIKN